MDKIWSLIWQSLKPFLSVAAAAGLIGLGISHWIEASIKTGFDKVMEDYKFQLRTYEQSAKIAEYASLVHDLKDTEDKQLYRRANQLSWELFLWLPDDVYRKLGRGLTSSSSKVELIDAMRDVRRLLLVEKAGTLGSNDIIVHGPNIRRSPPTQ